MKNFSHYLMLLLKGCAMGSADVVPGVSGGTIAFISGIYEELIESIRSINIEALKLLIHGRFRDFWRQINGAFLLPVTCGIAIAIFTLANVMTRLLQHHPIETWSFFFGLIIASAGMVARQVERWRISSFASLLCGVLIAAWITVATPAETPDTWWFVFLSGAIAICAMILPGISGAFILLLLGKYMFILQAVSEMNIPIILLFLIGAAAGIILFSHLLSWLLKHAHDGTVCLLMGFMIGSLNKVWPWKECVSTYLNRHGETVPLVERNVTPGQYEILTANESHLVSAIIFCAVGFLTIYTIEIAARIITKHKENSHA